MAVSPNFVRHPVAQHRFDTGVAAGAGAKSASAPVRIFAIWLVLSAAVEEAVLLLISLNRQGVTG